MSQVPGRRGAGESSVIVQASPRTAENSSPAAGKVGVQPGSPDGHLDAAQDGAQSQPSAAIPAPSAPRMPPSPAVPPQRRALIVTVAVALAAALAGALGGGLVGGYVGFHAATGGTQPGFGLGTVSPALTARPPASVAGVAARVLPSVVMVRVNGNQGTGSGFIISGGYIVTDNHVVTLDGQLRHASLQVVFSSGQSVPARLIGRDPYSDIAVIKPDTYGRLPAAALGNSGGLQVGDPVLAIGAPLGLAGTVTSGIVSALHRPVQPGSGGGSAQVYYDAIQTDAPINPGNSGGPLVDGHGKVIGVDAAIDTLGADPLTGAQGGSIGLGFAIPINQVRLIATELVRTGHAAHAVIGAVLNTAYRGSGAQILNSRAGIRPAGPAARAGLRPGDTVVGFGGQPSSSAYALLDAVRSQAPGARAAVIYVRNGVTRTAELRLGSALS